MSKKNQKKITEKDKALFYFKMAVCFLLTAILLVQTFQARKVYFSLRENKDTTHFISEIPSFTLREFFHNEKISEENFVGKNSYLHLWATWCPPCLKEFPEFLAFAQKKLKETPNAQFLFVATKDRRKDVTKFLVKEGIKEELLQSKGIVLVLDREGILLDKLGLHKLPETLYFNEEGELLKRYKGPQKWLTF